MKMNAKVSLALIALVGIGVFALPSTVALFSGQHAFYNIDATGNQIPCTKCHGDVKAELSSGLSTVTGTRGPHADFKCEYCHRAENGFASGDDAYAKITYSDTANTSDRVYLITTVQNFETGNFPKSIVYVAGISVDTWNPNVFNLDGTPFLNQTALQASGKYAGTLSPLSAFGTLGDTFAYSYASETSTETSTGPKDNQTATQNTAFNPRAVTWTAARSENLSGAGSREVTPGTQYHAASLVSCLECHGGEKEKGAKGFEIETAEPYNHANWLVDPTDPNSKCANCHYGSTPHTPSFEASLEAGGFNLTSYANDTGATEAHNDFVRPTTDGSNNVLRNGYGAANDACVACHTHVAVDINFQKKYALKFNANAFNGGNSTSKTGNWGVGGYSAQGTVNVEEFGNESGTSFATGNHSYSWMPTTGNLYMVDANGTNYSLNVTGLNNEATDNQSALTSP